MLYRRPFPPSPLLCLNVHLAGSPRDARAQTHAASVPSSSRAPFQAPEEREVDWEEHNYGSLLVVVGAKLRTSWQIYWQGYLTSTPKSWRLCCATCQHQMMLIKLQA